MKTKILSLLLCVGMLFACNNTQKGAAIGAGGGAVLGGVIGAIAGNTAVVRQKQPFAYVENYLA